MKWSVLPILLLVGQSTLAGEENAVTVLKGHRGDIACVAFTPDGKILASSGGTVKLWDVASKKEMRTLKEDERFFYCVAFSPDGRRLAGYCGSREDGITIWNYTTGRELCRFGKQTDATALAWSPDGKFLASSAGDEGIRIWDTRDTTKGKEIIRLASPDMSVLCLAFSPDGKTLASGGLDQTVLLWDVSTWKVRQVLKGHTDGVTSVSFTRDGKTLACSAKDQTVRIWETKTGKMIASLNVGKVTRAVVISPDGKRVATGDWDGLIKIWDVPTGKCLRLLKGHTEVIPGIAFSPDGRLLASASQDKTVRLWDLDALLEQK